MKCFAVQVVVLSKPLLGLQQSENPTCKHEWYKRIIEHAQLPVSKWFYETIKVDSALPSQGKDVLAQTIDSIQKYGCVEDSILLLDISSYVARAADFDSLYVALKKEFDCYSWIVLIFNENASAINADSLVEYYNNHLRCAGKIIVMDRVGQIYNLDKTTKETYIKYYPELMQNNDLLSDKEFRSLLLRKAGRHLGHFVTPSDTHIRTHYDILETVRDERGFDYILNKAKEFNSPNCFNLIIGFGLGTEGLIRLCGELSNNLEVPHEFYRNNNKANIGERISKGSDTILLVTDVVLKGNSAKEVSENIEQLGGCLVGVLSVVGLKESPPTINSNLPITYCVKLNRSFYEKKDDCPICLYSEIDIVKPKSEKDFSKALTREIEFYDFWELVYETNALQIGHNTSPNKNNHYLMRINTAKLLASYSDFVGAVLSQKIIASLGNDSVEVIACPNEQGALYLAYEIAAQLGVRSELVIAVERNDFEKCPPGGSRDIIPKSFTKIFDKKNVLCVDDGINSLHTYMHHSNFIRTAGGEVLGYAVFLNATNQTNAKKIRNDIGNRFFYFYQWGLSTYTERSCPVCSVKEHSSLLMDKI